MTRDEASAVSLTLWMQVQKLIPSRHQAEFVRLFDALAVVEADRRAADYDRGWERGVQIERLATLSTESTVTADGEWREGAKVQ